MAVDVLSEIVIDRPRAQVDASAADPSHVPDWYVDISFSRAKPVGVAGVLAAFGYFRNELVRVGE